MTPSFLVRMAQAVRPIPSAVGRALNPNPTIGTWAPPGPRPLSWRVLGLVDEAFDGWLERPIAAAAVLVPALAYLAHGGQGAAAVGSFADARPHIAAACYALGCWLSLTGLFRLKCVADAPNRVGLDAPALWRVGVGGALLALGALLATNPT